MSYCINKNTKEWKILLSQTDDNLARMIYHQYGRFPDLVKKTDLKREIGFKTEMENFAGMARKLGKYNTKHGTSHSFTKTRVYGNTWKLELHMNYLHRSVETERRRRAKKEPLFVATSIPEDADSGFTSPNIDSPSVQASRKTRYTPIETEADLGYFDENGDFKPNADVKNDIDFLIPSAPDALTDTEVVRKERIEKEIIQTKEGLKTTKDTATLRLLTARLGNLKAMLEDSKASVAASRKVAKYEDFLTSGSEHVVELENLLNQKNISPAEISYALRLIDLWSQIGDFSMPANKHIILDEYEFNTPEIREKFQLLGNRISVLESNFQTLKEEAVLDFTRKFTRGDLTEDEIFSSMKDMSWQDANLVNQGRSQDPMMRAMFNSIEYANTNAQVEASEVWEDLDSLSKRILKKTGNNYNIFKQLSKNGKETGRMVSRFSDDFYTTRKAYATKAFHTYKDGKLKYNKNDIAAYFDWVDANTATFDTRYLFPDLSEDETVPEEFLYNRIVFSEEEKAKEIARLEKHLGKKGTEFYLARQEKLIEKYRLQRDSKYENVFESADSEFANLSLAEKKVLFQDWLKENSPYWASDMIDNPLSRSKGKGEFYKNGGFKYAIQIPKKSENGKDLGWYDKNFEKIEADADLLEFHTLVSDILNKMHYLLPEDKRRMMGVGSLPTVSKMITEMFGEAGLRMGITPFMDKLKQLQTTTDLSTTISSDVNPKDGAIQRTLGVSFVEDIEAEVNKQARIKTIAYKKANPGKVMSAPELRAIKEEIRNNLSQNKSWDLVRILKAYSLSVIAYKHKMAIEPQIRLMQDQFNTRKETVTNKAGKSLFKNNKEASETGLKNYKESMQYMLDVSYWGVGGRDVEGVSKKKLYTKEEKARKIEIESLLEDAENTTEKDRALLQSELDNLGGHRTLSGVGDTLLKYMTVKSLAWNVFSGVSNTGFGVISNLIEASDGRVYNMKQMRKAYSLTMSSVGKNLTFGAITKADGTAIKIRTLMDKYDLMKTSNQELFDTSNKSSTSKLKKFGPFSIQERTEYVNYAPIMISIMMGMEAKNANGDTVELWDAYDSEGVLKEGFTTDVDEVKMVQKIRRAIEMAHGDYNNPLKIKKKFLGRAASQFRTWMFEGYYNRFEEQREDETLGYTGRADDTAHVRKGRYRSYTAGQTTTAGAIVGTTFLPGVGTIIGAGVGALVGKWKGLDTDMSYGADVLFTLKQLGRKLATKTQFDEAGFSKVDAANMRKNMTELYLLVTLAGVAVLMKAMAGDDDDDEGKFMMNFLLNQTTRLQTDINFYTNPLEAEKLTKTALPLLGLMKEAGTFFTDVAHLFDDDLKNDSFASGDFKGMSKLAIHGGLLIPGVATPIKTYKSINKTFE